MNLDYYPLLAQLAEKPEPFSIYTTADLWTQPYLAKQMLNYHLHPELDISSRNHAFIDRSVNWIVGRFGLGVGSRVIDFGCGPGLYCQRFARKGINVTGIDFSENSIRYAREQALLEHLDVVYVNDDYLEVALLDSTYDFAQMIMCDYCAIGPEKRRVLLDKIRKTLKDDGRFLLDVYSLNAFDKKEEGTSIRKGESKGFWCEQPCIEMQQSFTYPETCVSLDRYHISQPETTKVYYNWLQYFSVETLTAEVEAAGFAVEWVGLNVAGDAFESDNDEFAVVLKKK